MSHDHHHHAAPKAQVAHNGPWQQVHVDEDVLGHWQLVLPLCQKEHHGQFPDPKIHAAFRQDRHHKSYGYWFQVKVGHKEHAAEWTVKCSIDKHHATLEGIEMGFKTYY